MQEVTFWNKVLPLLKSELTTIGYNTWIKTIKPIGFDNNRIILEVPAEFNRGILNSRYLTLIKNAIFETISRNLDVEIKLPTDSVEDNSNQSVDNNNNIVTDSESALNKKYTFDTFVIGNSNRLAHAASVAVAEAPAKAYNPLFLYGGVGLGKTHLMHAIGHYSLSVNSDMKVLYVSSEKFTNELINAIKDDKNEDFRAKYRNIDILLIDDIQFIGGKERTQEEFFHTFNALYEANKQIIISSDKSPSEITTLEERLKSRFEWGLIADIQSPDLETRIAILTKKAQSENREISYDVLAFIAEKIPSNIRQLEGALTRVIAYSSLTDTPITIDLAKEALKDLMIQKVKREINVKLIKDTVGRYFDIKSSDFTSKRRSREISYPRQIAMYLCRELTEMSLPKIGDSFGGRDHTTVIHAYEKINKEISKNSETKRVIHELTKNIQG